MTDTVFLKSKYKIGDKVGENPFSVTYKGTFLGTDKPVIIKIYKRGTLNNSLIQIMKNKVKAMIDFSHSGVAKIYDGDYGWQGFYYVREFVEGKSLAEAIKENRVFEEEVARETGAEICEILQAVHAQGAVHGALNPNNVFILSNKKNLSRENRGIKLTDFVIEGSIRESMPQKAEFIAKSPEYLSPEELQGEAAQASSDIYRTGLLLYEMLSGKNPFLSSSPLKSAFRRLKEAPPALALPETRISKIMEDIIFKALEKDPMIRFQTILELKESLLNKAVISNQPMPEIALVGYEESASTLSEEPEGRIRMRIPNRGGKMAIEGEALERKRSWRLILIMGLAILAGLIYGILQTFIGR